MENEKMGSLDLAPEVFEGRVRPHLYHAEVCRQLATRRRGTHSTKNRAAVSGGGIKPFRQKGTGRARQGTIRAPQMSGGGVVFGPVPRGYSHRLPKKMRRAALLSALAEAVAAGSITVVDKLEVDDYKTRKMMDVLSALDLLGTTVLIVLEEENPMVEVSVRNIPGVGLVRAEGLNVYDILRHSKMLITKAAIESLQTRLGARGIGGRES